MNTKIIEPVSVWTMNGPKNATILSLANFFNYHFDEGAGTVEYLLLGMESIGENPESAVEYYKANLEIPSSVIQQWGADDSIIWNYVIQQLGLVEVTQ